MCNQYVIELNACHDHDSLAFDSCIWHVHMTVLLYANVLFVVCDVQYVRNVWTQCGIWLRIFRDYRCVLVCPRTDWCMPYYISYARILIFVPTCHMHVMTHEMLQENDQKIVLAYHMWHIIIECEIVCFGIRMTCDWKYRTFFTSYAGLRIWKNVLHIVRRVVWVRGFVRAYDFAFFWTSYVRTNLLYVRTNSNRMFVLFQFVCAYE